MAIKDQPTNLGKVYEPVGGEPTNPSPYNSHPKQPFGASGGSPTNPSPYNIHPLASALGWVTSTIKWHLTNVLNLDATIGSSATNNSTSATYAREYDDTIGIVVSSTAVPAGIEVTEGMRKSTDTDEGGSVAAPVFLNSISKTDSTKLHPNKVIILPGGKLQTVYLLYDYRANSEVVVAGDHRYIVGTDHNYALTCTAGGTTHTAAPAVAKIDLGSTVTETGGVVWSVDSHYSNIATETENHLPHILNEDVAVNLALQSQDFTDAVWVNNAYVTADQAIAPDGTLTADLFSQASSYLSQTAIVADGQTKSVWVRTVSGTGTTAIGGHNSLSKYHVTLTEDWKRFDFPSDAGETGGTNFYVIDTRYGTLTEAYLWQADLTDKLGTPIPTTTGSVQRNATSMTVTPATADFLRLRFADVLSQTYLSSGTVAVSYDGTTLTVTDGVNSMTHVVAMTVGDWITIKESTGELYYRENLVSTNALYAPTWGEIELGNAVDYRFDDDLDPTDVTWSTP